MAGGQRDGARWESASADELLRPKTDKGLAEKGKEWLYAKMGAKGSGP
jgi:hypothetical protein